jgi:Protein of unknown function (DUF4239)
MNLYWVYNLPNWVFELLTIGFFVLFSLAGMLPSRNWARRYHVQQSHNDIVGFYFAATTVLYGVTLGLLAVGAWTTFTETQTKVSHEAAILSALYRAVDGLDEPIRSTLKNDLRVYTRHVIDVAWPEQRRGIEPAENKVFLDRFENDFQSYEHRTETDTGLERDISQQFDSLTEARSIRMDSVNLALPTALWTLVLIGGLICIVVTWFFHMPSLKMHFWMTALFSCLLGLMIFMVAALDNPYRGKISVGPEAFERAYGRMIETDLHKP